MRGVGFFRRRDFSFFVHAVEDEVAAGEGERGIIERRKFWAVDHAGEERGFLEFQVGDGLAEIKLRGGGESIVAVGEINLIGIHGEDLRLGVAALDLEREENFLHFAAKGAVAAVEEKIAGELHGDGAGSAGDAMFEDVARGGSSDAREIDAPVIFEVLVLDGGDRVVEDFGDLLVGHEDAALESEAADHLSVVGVDFGDDCGAIGFEGANFGEFAGVDEEESAGGAERDGAEEEEAEGDAVNELEAAEAESERGET